MRSSLLLLALALASACSGGDPIDQFLPPTPATGGAAVCAAGPLTAANVATESVPGPASQGLVGDWFLRNDKIHVVVQAPGRAIGPCPYGGNLIDMDRLDGKAGDQLGEVAPFLQLGRTVEFTRGEVVLDGSKGGPAVLRFYGHDALDDYINVTGLGGLTGAIESDFRADVDLGLEVAATYVLAPGESHVEVTWTFYNPSDSERDTMVGTISDTGANIEVFHPYIGYGDFSIGDLLGTGSIPMVEYVAFQGQGVSYGILPRFSDATLPQKNLPFPVSGVDVEVWQLSDKGQIIGAGGQTLKVPAKGGVSRTVDVIVGTDAADLESQARGLKQQPVAMLSGSVKTASGKPVPGARVIVEEAQPSDPAHAVVTVFTADASGAFASALPPAAYKLTAEGDAWLRGAPVMATPGAGGPVALTIPDGATIGFKVHDASGQTMPARVVVVGRPANAPDRRFRDTIKDHLPTGIAASLATRHGDSTLGGDYDHPLVVAPGRYRVVASRGPEWSRFEQVVDVTPSGVMVDATLARVLDTTGYVACDFHQHANWSPDSPVPPRDRVVTYLAEGVEFIASSEHDYHFDYSPVIKDLDGVGLLDSAVGVEVTPFDYGHFIGFPVAVDPNSPNHGSLDWGNSPATGLDLAPAEIYDGLRKLGAGVVEMNHPRAAAGSDVMSQFQRNFDRAGLAFDFAAHSFGGKEQLQLVGPAELGLPDGAELFSPTFDALEAFNGGALLGFIGDGRPIDPVTENVLRDWMNFLSFGFAPTAVGNSDSHEWVDAPAGLPRSLVRVPDDSADGIAKGVGADVVKTVAGHDAPRDVVVTNAPMIAFTVDGKGLGQVVQHTAQGGLDVQVKVQAATWAAVDTVEIYANATFDVPVPKGQMPTPLQPALCFTTRGAPTARCSAAIGGARPLTVATVAANGDQRVEATASATIDPAQLAALNRSGASGKDLWLVAMTFGDSALFPTIPVGLAPDADVSAIVEKGGASLAGQGVVPFAFTNPILVDVDGGGWKAPFAP